MLFLRCLSLRISRLLHSLHLSFSSAMATRTQQNILEEKAYSKHEEFLDDVPNEANILTPEELEVEKKLRRKIDLLIMPLVVLVYLMNYIDR